MKRWAEGTTFSVDRFKSAKGKRKTRSNPRLSFAQALFWAKGTTVPEKPEFRGSVEPEKMI
jgi:hypothetical protein